MAPKKKGPVAAGTGEGARTGRIGRRAARRSRVVVVGLDYGTHSTKVVVRRRVENSKGEVLCFDSREEGESDEYPVFASPSLVRVVGDRLFFGRESIRRQGTGVEYRSLKLCLIGEQEGGGPAHDLAADTVDLLVAAYLSWALGRIREELSVILNGDEPQIVLNLAAPMNHFGDEKLRGRYLRIVHAAWGAALEGKDEGVLQGCTMDRAGVLLGGCLSGAEVVPGRETRLFEILPETVAPLVSLSNSPDCEPGMYAVVDVGAGTTEVSVIHVGEGGAEQKIVCYSDQSIVLGGDALQRAEAGEGAREELGSLGERFRRCFQRVWHEGYRKDSANPAARKRWRRLTILRTGGAGRHPVVERVLGWGHPGAPRGMAPRVEVEAYDHDTWYRPPVRLPGARRSMKSEDLHLLAVADGLSFHRMNWPTWFRPGEVGWLEESVVIENDPTWYQV